MWTVRCVCRAFSAKYLYDQTQQQACFICTVVLHHICPCCSTSLHIHAGHTEQESSKALLQSMGSCTARCARHCDLTNALQTPMSLLPYFNRRGQYSCGVDNNSVVWTTSTQAKTHAAVFTSPLYFATQRAPPQRPASSGKSPQNSSRPSAAGRQHLRRGTAHRLSWRHVLVAAVRNNASPCATTQTSLVPC
jgi:hypothetical protein